MVEIGDTIKILALEGEPNSSYVNVIGIVNGFDTDCYGETRMFGTWGSIFIYPDKDEFKVIRKADH